MAAASPSSSELSSPPASDDEVYGLEPQCHPRAKEPPTQKPSEEEVIVAVSGIEKEESRVHDTITVATTITSPAVSVKATTPAPLEVTAVVNGKESPPPAQVTSDIQSGEIEAAEPLIDVGETPSSSCASSRPKRKRESKVQPSATAPAPAVKKALTPAAKRRKKQWEPPFVYTSPNSPLVKKNIDLRVGGQLRLGEKGRYALFFLLYCLSFFLMISDTVNIPTLLRSPLFLPKSLYPCLPSLIRYANIHLRQCSATH